jgi:hypothetical protein
MAESRNPNTDAQGTVMSESEEQARHLWEDKLTGDELAHLPFLDPGAELRQGQSYLDLNQLTGGPLTLTGSRQVRDGERMVAQGDLDPDIWRKLVGEG